MSERFRVDIYEIEEDETTQWFWDFRKQILFSSDKKSRQLRCLSSSREKDNSYNYIIKYKDKLIAIPVIADDVLIYDIIMGVSSKLALPMGIWNVDAQKKGKFGGSIIFDKYLILLPSWSNIICKIDMEQEKIVEIKDISDLGIKTDGAIPFCKAILEGEYIYMTVGEEPALVIINARTLEYSKKVFSYHKKGFCTIVKQGEDFWLFPRYGEDIVKWVSKTDEEERYPFTEEILCSESKTRFGSAIGDGTSLWIFPETAPEVLRFNTKTGKINKEKAFSKYSAYERDTDNYVKYWLTRYNNSLLEAFSAIKGVLVQYDIQRNCLQELPYYLSSEGKIRYFVNIDTISNNILNDSNPINLLEYVKIIQEKDFWLCQKGKNKLNGEKIYQTIMTE